MNMAAPQVVPIFCTPFGVVPLAGAAQLNPAVAAAFTAYAQDPARAAPGSTPLCFRSPEDLTEWTDDPVRQLLAGIVAAVRSVVATINQFTPAQLGSLTAQARACFTIVRPDGCLPQAQTRLSSWCAVYCVAAPAPSAERYDSGVLRLYEGRLGTMFADASNAAPRIPYTPGHYTWRPVPGEVAVFPAPVSHEVALLRATTALVLVTARVRFVAPGQEGVSAW